MKITKIKAPSGEILESVSVSDFCLHLAEENVPFDVEIKRVFNDYVAYVINGQVIKPNMLIMLNSGVDSIVITGKR